MVPLRPSRRLFLAAASAAGLGGCIPAPYEPYYRPSTAQAGARERRAWCQGHAGPVTGLDLDLGGGLEMRAWTEKANASGVPLRLEFTVPPRTLLRFQDAPALLAEGRALGVPFAASAFRGFTVDPGERIDPQALRPGTPLPGSDAPHGRLLLRTQPLAIGAPPRIVAQGLAFARGDRSVALPPATMRRVASRTLAYAYRSDEEHARLLQRAEACRRETPRLACQNILDFADASDSGEVAGASWNWRWWVAPRANPPGPEGEFTLSVKQPGPWRLDTSRLELRDADAGTAHPLRFAPGILAFADRFDPTRELPAAAAKTRLLFEATLPERVPAFELAAGRLLRDGQPVALAPLRFDRRAIDGGLEPFNC